MTTSIHAGVQPVNARRGRPREAYLTQDTKTQINGLRRRQHDGRWVIVETGHLFSEPDEAKAIAHCRKLKSKRTRKAVHVEAVIDRTAEELNEHGGERMAASLAYLRHPRGGFRCDHIDSDKQGVTVGTSSIGPAILWPWLRKKLDERPEWLAEMTGESLPGSRTFQSASHHQHWRQSVRTTKNTRR